MKTTLREFRALRNAIQRFKEHAPDSSEISVVENYLERIKLETMAEKDRRRAENF